MYEVERYHDFCAGHRVYGHESKCAHLHGHNYRVYFTVAPERERYSPGDISFEEYMLDNVGRVVDFSVVKSALCEWLEEMWDHKILIWENDPILTELRAIDPKGVVGVTFNPTAENMAKHLVEVVGPQYLVNTGAELITCRVEETRKCSATYRKGV